MILKAILNPETQTQNALAARGFCGIGLVTLVVFFSWTSTGIDGEWDLAAIDVLILLALLGIVHFGYLARHYLFFGAVEDDNR